MSRLINGNLLLESFPALDWGDQANTLKSLDAIKYWAIEHAKRAGDWYLIKKTYKHVFARYSRVLAIILSALAGVFPVIGQIVGTADHPYLLNPSWATVLAASVATIIAFDRFMGWSTSWSRFLIAATDIRLATDEFEFQWQEQLKLWNGAQLTNEEVHQAIALVRAFVAKVDRIVREETAIWVTEFQSTLRHLDDVARTKPVIASQASVNMVVTNGDQCDAPGWRVTFDTGQSFDKMGKSAAVVGLPIGNRMVSIVGRISGKKVAAEKAVALDGGNPVTVEFTLG